MIDLATVISGFQQLERATYRRPDLPKDLHDLARSYQEHWDLPTELFLPAVTEHIREDGRFWPKVGELRKLARTIRAARGQSTQTGLAADYWAWEKAGWRDAEGRFTPCPVCGSVVEPHGRIEVLHDRRRHAEARVPFIGNAAGAAHV